MSRPPNPNRQMVPRADRHSVSFEAAIAGPTVHAYRTPVANVSASGMLLKDAASLQVGDVLTATLPSLGPITCTVARLRSGEAGVKFDRSIDVARLIAA